METSDARGGLDDVERLQAATKREYSRVPGRMLAAMAVGAVAFLAFCAVASETAIGWASIVWIVFVGVFVYAARREQLARPLIDRNPRGYLLLTAGMWLFAVGTVVVAGRPPWLVIGLIGALWGTSMGMLGARRARHA